MDTTMKLRAACGHDSRSVEGCTNCEAADLIESLRRGAATQRAEIERLTAERDGLRADAERYRWLRAGKARTTGRPKEGRIEVIRWEDSSEGDILKLSALDNAIDAARTALVPKGDAS